MSKSHKVLLRAGAWHLGFSKTPPPGVLWKAFCDATKTEVWWCSVTSPVTPSDWGVNVGSLINSPDGCKWAEGWRWEKDEEYHWRSHVQLLKFYQNNYTGLVLGGGVVSHPAGGTVKVRMTNGTFLLSTRPEGRKWTHRRRSRKHFHLHLPWGSSRDLCHVLWWLQPLWDVLWL